MRLQLEITLLCIITTVWIQPALSDGISTQAVANKWTCTCSVKHQEKLNFVPSNCSSCNCSPVSGGSSENKWTCICSMGQMPRLVGEQNDSSCFSACNCHAGTISDLEQSKKQISSKIVLIVLLLCVLLTALAFIASALLYVYRKDKHSVQWASSPSDRLTSCGSGVNFMSLAGSSLPAYEGYLHSSVKPLLGCIPKPFFVFRGKTGTICGSILQFSYSELESATNRFSDSNLIGVGGSSHVYRGSLRDGRTVAVKRMKTQGGLDADLVFLTEIELISRLHHCHIVPLLGYCLENQGKHVERLQVFEYIPNGNLRECLDGGISQCLDWNTRVAIALGAARGLEYLHEAAAPRILHRDVKSTNILLDEKWQAKITDLGMAKHLHNDGILSCSTSPARMQGTFGYFAPEYAIIGRASLKSDVFSFGVVLLELITGRKPIYKSSNTKGEESLVIWATPRLHDSKRVISELPDPCLEGNFQEEEMHVMAYLAKECLLLDPDLRPSMSEVVQILSSIAPDKSKRKNLPLHVFQFSSTGGTKTSDQEASNGLYYTEEIKEITSEMPARRAVPDRDLCNSENENIADDSASDVEKLMLLTTKPQSNDEGVDLTEPRLESFRLADVDCHIVKIT